MIAVRRLGFTERRKLQQWDLVGLEAAQHVEGPVVDHEWRDALARMYELLERRSPRKRALFVHCLEERTIAEASKELGVSLATAHREVRAVRRFAVRCIGIKVRAGRPLASNA
jgi:DNA-directed RNA polymerase specialized sigma24 family protein